MRLKPMMKEQRCEQIPGAVDGDRQVRRAHTPEACLIPSPNGESAGRGIVEVERRRYHDPRSPCAQRRDCPPRGLQVVRPRAGQPFELEGVWRGDGGEREGAVTEELAYARGHVDPRPDISDHRIARVGRRAIGRKDAFARPQSGLADLRLPEIAGQETGATGKHADRFQSAQAIVDHRCVEGATAPACIAHMTGILHCHQRPDLATEPLERKCGRRIADMAIDNMRLDREDWRKHNPRPEDDSAAGSKRNRPLPLRYVSSAVLTGCLSGLSKPETMPPDFAPRPQEDTA